MTLAQSWKDVVPSVRIDLFDGLEDEIARILERISGHAVDTAIHGARMAGQVLTFAEEERQMVRWVMASGPVDHCEDCVALHGRVMSYSDFLDQKFTTKCNGNCLCEAEPIDSVNGDTETPLTLDEINAAGEQP